MQHPISLMKNSTKKTFRPKNNLIKAKNLTFILRTKKQNEEQSSTLYFKVRKWFNLNRTRKISRRQNMLIFRKKNFEWARHTFYVEKMLKNETERHQKKSLQKMTTVLSQYFSSTVIGVSYQEVFYLWTLNLNVFSTLNRGTDASFKKIETFDRELEFKLEKYWLKLCVSNRDKVPKQPGLCSAL